MKKMTTQIDQINKLKLGQIKLKKKKNIKSKRKLKLKKKKGKTKLILLMKKKKIPLIRNYLTKKKIKMRSNFNI